jgi:hypothetical protein
MPAHVHVSTPTSPPVGAVGAATWPAHQTMKTKYDTIDS